MKKILITFASILLILCATCTIYADDGAELGVTVSVNDDETEVYIEVSSAIASKSPTAKFDLLFDDPIVKYNGERIESSYTGVEEKTVSFVTKKAGVYTIMENDGSEIPQRNVDDDTPSTFKVVNTGVDY